MSFAFHCGSIARKCCANANTNMSAACVVAKSETVAITVRHKIFSTRLHEHGGYGVEYGPRHMGKHV